MFEQRVKVLKIENNIMWIDTTSQSACGSCQQRKRCSATTFENAFTNQKKPLPLVNSIKAQTGDWIIVGINETDLLRSTALLYLLPIISMILFSVIGNLIELNEISIVLSALIGLGIGGIASYWFLAPTLANLNPVPLRISNSL
ncbi:MAG: hypothetical protein RIT27_1347 [Pseudomonadota bacterium]|jgi:sigma-E factor negative regulatory protein RseC